MEIINFQQFGALATKQAMCYVFYKNEWMSQNVIPFFLCIDFSILLINVLKNVIIKWLRKILIIC